MFYRDGWNEIGTDLHSRSTCNSVTSHGGAYLEESLGMRFLERFCDVVVVGKQAVRDRCNSISEASFNAALTYMTKCEQVYETTAYVHGVTCRQHVRTAQVYLHGTHRIRSGMHEGGCAIAVSYDL